MVKIREILIWTLHSTILHKAPFMAQLYRAQFYTGQYEGHYLCGTILNGKQSVLWHYLLWGTTYMALFIVVHFIGHYMSYLPTLLLFAVVIHSWNDGIIQSWYGGIICLRYGTIINSQYGGVIHSWNGGIIQSWYGGIIHLRHATIIHLQYCGVIQSMHLLLFGDRANLSIHYYILVQHNVPVIPTRWPWRTKVHTTDHQDPAGR